MFRKNGSPKGFREVAEGCTKFTSSQEEERLLLMPKKATIGFAEVERR